MIRFQTMSSKVTHRVAVLTRYLPPLGAPPTYEQPVPFPLADFAQRTSRNRWNRPDLIAAIGQGCQEADVAVQVWPPTPGNI